MRVETHRIALVVWLALGSSLACRGGSQAGDADARSTTPPLAPAHEVADKTIAGVDLVDRIARCEVDHEGVLVDLGSSAVQGTTGYWALSAESSLSDTERDGETWSRLASRNLSLRFVLEEASPLFVSM